MDEQPNRIHDLSPDEQVAQQIASQLTARGLVRAAQATVLARGLADGTLKAADWRVLAENAIEVEARRDAAH